MTRVPGFALGLVVGAGLGAAVGAWVYPLSEFITQAVLGRSPLNPTSKET